MIGIIGAMDMEICALLEKLEDDRVKTVSGIAFHEGRLQGKAVVIAKCGAGKVNAAVCAQTMLLMYPLRAMINIGVAGGINTHIGDLVIAQSVVQHDMDTTALGEEKGLLSGLNQVFLSCDDALCRRLYEAACTVYPGHVHRGVVATGDQFIASAKKVLEIGADFGACACEMEGGSIGQVCAMAGLAFAVIRAVSDNANDTGATDFTAFCRDAAEKSCRLLCAFLARE